MPNPANVLLPWSSKIEDLAENLQTDVKKGLVEEEAESRLASLGKNIFARGRDKSALSIFLHQFQSPLIIILSIAVIVTLLIHEWLDAAIIFFAIAVNTGLGFYQEYKAERIIADLRSYIQERVRVIRGGKEREMDAALLVPGDIIRIGNGARIPADSRLISAVDFSVDEAILTGESLPADKGVDTISETVVLAERTNMIFGGTLAVGGTAHAIVTAIGPNTEIGKLARLVAETRQERTPLQKAVSKLAWIIALGASVLVSIIFALGILRGEPLFDMLLVSIAIIVGAVPEALPIGLTAVLAVGVERIARRKGIMRNLTAAETLGSTTVIMTDKTGTLTEARMRLDDIVLASELAKESPYTYAPRERFSSEQKDMLRLALSNADVVVENPEDPHESWRMSGHALEVNVVQAAAQHGINIFKPESYIASHIILPFNSTHKFSIASARLPLETSIIGAKSGTHLIVMGAPDELLKRSKMDKDAYVRAIAHIEEMSGHGRRILGIAVLPHEGDIGRIGTDSAKDLTFVGVLGFHDPIRQEVPAALKRIERYGVRVIMATGDLKGTAVAVALELGWDMQAGAVLSGEDIKQLNDEELSESLDRVRIYARVTPEDKLRIARLFQARGEVVAMTGDGVNDAPSLKAANIGIAIGSGSDVAKGVADLVLLDNNFSTIVAAIEEGKQMLQNIRKIFVYLMSNSLDEVILIGGSIIAGIALPLTAIQIIWVNLFTGSLPAIAYAFDRDKDVEGRRGERGILNSEVKFLTVGIGVLTSLLLFALYWSLVMLSVELSVARSVLFACFASYILAVAFSLRDLRRPLFAYHIFGNKLLVAGVAIGFSLLLATIYVPYLQNIFGTVAIGPAWMLFICGWIALNIVLVEAAKWFFNRRSRSSAV